MRDAFPDYFDDEDEEPDRSNVLLWILKLVAAVAACFGG